MNGRTSNEQTKHGAEEIESDQTLCEAIWIQKKTVGDEENEKKKMDWIKCYSVPKVCYLAEMFILDIQSPSIFCRFFLGWENIAHWHICH